MSVTQAELARRLKLHQATVSRCFIAPDRVNQQTLTRVLTTADALGYRRHSGASAMRRNRVGAVGLLLGASGNDNFLPLGLLKNLERQARAHDQRLVISHVADEKLTDPDYVPGVLRELAVDGLIIDYIANSPQRMAELLDRYRVPAIWLNSKRDVNAVYVDDHEAGRRATRIFAEHGHKRVAFLGLGATAAPGVKLHYSIPDRVCGMAGAAREAGLQWTDLSIDGHVSDPRCLDALTARLQQTDRPTAVLVNGATEASLLQAAAYRCGLSIPDDLSVVALGPMSVSLPGRFIDTFVLPQGELARAVLEEMNLLLAEPIEARPALAVPFEVRTERGSVAPPRP